MDKWVVKEASKALNINYSTAKSILRMFRLTGKIYIRPKKNELKEDLSDQASQNDHS